MKKLLLVLILIVLPLSNLNAQDNNIINKSVEEILNLKFKSIELQPLTKGFDFPCYNSCKERNNEDYCMQLCSLK